MGDLRSGAVVRPVADPLAGPPGVRPVETAGPGVQREGGAQHFEERGGLVTLDDVPNRRLPQMATSPSEMTGDGPDEDVGQILVFTGPSDVAALQELMKADLESVRSSLQRCALAGTFSPDTTPGDWDAWQSMKARAESFIKETPSLITTVSQYQRGETLQTELAGWHDRARAFGCDAGPAPQLNPVTPMLSGFELGGLGGIVLIFLLMQLMGGKKGR